MSSADADEMFSCDGCGNMMSGKCGSKWYRCTLCDIDICKMCKIVQDFHIHHKLCISNFTCPGDMSSPYCDGCGQNFESTDHVYQCQQCKDFILCQWCKYKDYHGTHQSKKVSIKEYMSEL